MKLSPDEDDGVTATYELRSRTIVRTTVRPHAGCEADPCSASSAADAADEVV